MGAGGEHVAQDGAAAARSTPRLPKGLSFAAPALPAAAWPSHDPPDATRSLPIPTRDVVSGRLLHQVGPSATKAIRTRRPAPPTCSGEEAGTRTAGFTLLEVLFALALATILAGAGAV